MMINARDFFDEFKSMVKEETIVTEEMLPKYPELWNDMTSTFMDVYKGRKQSIYTKLINNYVIQKIIEKAEMEVIHEYFKIDTIGWIDNKEKMADECGKLKLTPYLWDLCIAVEHENNSKEWIDEVMKLAYIKCPLKVVIGYNYCDERENEENGRIDMIGNWLLETKAFNVDKDEEFLLIFGNRNNGTKHYKDFDFRGYLFDWETRRFIRI